MIDAKDISFRYSESSSFALRCQSIRAKAGEVTCIVGPNGSGKSTLLRIIGGRIRCRSGSVEYRNRDIGSYPEEQLMKEIGWIDSSAVSSLVPEMLVVDHLALALLAGRQPVPLFHRSLNIAKMMGKTRMPDQLAGEMQALSGQRIADLNSGARQALTIALALINPHKLILADEGTAMLDVRNARRFFASMQGLTVSHSVAVLAVTHDVMLACRYSDCIYFAKDGIVQEFVSEPGWSTDVRIHALERLFFGD